MSDKLLQANLKAAELLGKSSVCRVCPLCGMKEGPVNPLDTKCAGCGQEADIQLIFSIANPSDRDAVVQMLGEKYGVYFVKRFGESEGNNHSGWFAFDIEDNKIVLAITYQDAVVAAVESV